MANILIVQEAEQTIGDIKLALAPAGHQILTAKSVENAVTLLRSASFDLVVCSVYLNHGTVFDLLKFVRNDPIHSSAPFVCFCGPPTELGKSVDNTVRLIAKLLGADKYLAQAEFVAEQFRADIELLLAESRQSNCRASRQAAKN